MFLVLEAIGVYRTYVRCKSEAKGGEINEALLPERIKCPNSIRRRRREMVPSMSRNFPIDSTIIDNSTGRTSGRTPECTEARPKDDCSSSPNVGDGTAISKEEAAARSTGAATVFRFSQEDYEQVLASKNEHIAKLERSLKKRVGAMEVAKKDMNALLGQRERLMESHESKVKSLQEIQEKLRCDVKRMQERVENVPLHRYASMLRDSVLFPQDHRPPPLSNSAAAAAAAAESMNLTLSSFSSPSILSRVVEEDDGEDDVLNPPPAPPGPFDVDTSYMIRLKALLCKEVHKIASMAEQAHISENATDLVIKYLQKRTVSVEEEHVQDEREWLNEMMSVEVDTAQMKLKYQERVDANQRDIQSLKRQLQLERENNDRFGGINNSSHSGLFNLSALAPPSHYLDSAHSSNSSLDFTDHISATSEAADDDSTCNNRSCCSASITDEPFNQCLPPPEENYDILTEGELSLQDVFALDGSSSNKQQKLWNGSKKSPLTTEKGMASSSLDFFRTFAAKMASKKMRRENNNNNNNDNTTTDANSDMNSLNSSTTSFGATSSSIGNNDLDSSLKRKGRQQQNQNNNNGINRFAAILRRKPSSNEDIDTTNNSSFHDRTTRRPSRSTARTATTSVVAAATPKRIVAAGA